MPQGLEHLPFLRDRDGLEDFQVGRMDGKQAHKLYEAFGHATVEWRELLKMFPNLAPLLIGLGQ